VCAENRTWLGVIRPLALLLLEPAELLTELFKLRQSLGVSLPEFGELVPHGFVRVLQLRDVVYRWNGVSVR
jgi:hypothetical protein